MKTIFLLFFVAIYNSPVVRSYYTVGHDGRPGCKTDLEMIRPWKNNFDPTKYFVCIIRGEPGIEAKCPLQMGFMDAPPLFGCVRWEQYSAMPPYDPPSLARMPGGKL